MATLLTGKILSAALLGIAWNVIKDQGNHQQLASRTHWDTEYDFIVVGSGAAGSVIASRLSENPSVSVLLLERGSAARVSNDIPALDVLNLITPTDKTQDIVIQPQEYASFGFPNRQFAYLIHHALGGGTSQNGMFYNRGGKGDYDGWALDYGAFGWAYSDVLPFFKKSEDQKNPELTTAQNSLYHGTGGLLSVTSPPIPEAPPTYQLLIKSMQSAAEYLGYPTTDINGANQIGFGIIQRTVKNGRRASTANAFLEPARHRPNLHILADAFVTQVLFEDPTHPKRATGVEFIYKNVLYSKVKARKEIILSAGPVSSAQILMLSGIGPQDHLKDLGIPLVADLPVGKNFHDHARVGGVDFVLNTTLFTFWEDLLTVRNLESFYKNGSGPLSTTFYQHQAGVINIRTSVPSRLKTFGPSDVFISPFLIPPTPGIVDLVITGPQIIPSIWDEYYGPYLGRPQLNLVLTLNYVVSRGRILLKSTNPYDDPLLNPNYLSDRDDVARMIEAYKIAQKIGETPAFLALGAQPFETTVPICRKYLPKTSDQYIECVIRTFTASELHAAGACKMTEKDDPTGVVDPKLKVQGGVKGLRVADSSIAPSVPTGNMMAPTIMIGEKAAAMILEDNYLE